MWHTEVFCTRIHLIFVFCWALPMLVLKIVFWEYSCFKSDEKGTKNAIMLVKLSSREHCIIPACELLVFWFSIKINKDWKMTSSCWLCANFITQPLPSEVLCKQVYCRGCSLNREVFLACYHRRLTASQSLSAHVKTDPVPMLGHVLEIHLSSKSN